MIAVIFRHGIPGSGHTDFKILDIFPGHGLLEAELVGAAAQMNVIALLLHGTHPNLDLGIRLIIALHSHRHGVQIPLIQVAGQFHTFQIGVLSLLCLIDARQ